MIEIYLIFALLLPLSLCEDTYCPNATLVSPCICVNNEIICSGNDTIDLPEMFDRMSNELQDNRKHFWRLYLNNSAINELTNNTFKDITFEVILIYMAMNLQRIDRNAFNANNVTKVFEIRYSPRLTQSDDNSLFEMLSKFVNIEDIELTDNNITEIPDNAFNVSLNQLKRFNIQGYSIRKLGEYAFQHLGNLNELYIVDTNIDHIPENAFYFQNQSNVNLYIGLFFNPFVSSDSFAPNSLARIGRPVTLRLGYHSTPRQMTYLNESIFLPFFKSNTNNTIDMRDEWFDCNDCRSYWLAKNKEIIPRIKLLKCINGRQFEDKKNFVNCTKLVDM